MLDNDLMILINLVDLHERTTDADVKVRLKSLLVKIFDKIDGATEEPAAE